MKFARGKSGDFAALIESGCYYVDKTRFLRYGDQTILIWITVLSCSCFNTHTGRQSRCMN